MKKANSSVKKVLSLIMSLALFLTSFTLSGFAPTLEAEAAEEQAAVSHTKELLHYSFYGDNFSLSSLSNYQGTITTPTGNLQEWCWDTNSHSISNGYYFNADGGFHGSFTAISGLNNWTFTYKGYSQNRENNGDCEIGLGTAAGNTDVVRVSSTGEIYVNNESLTRGTGTLNYSSSTTFDESKVNTIVFRYDNSWLTVIINGTSFGTFSVSSGNNVNYIYSGVNGTNSVTSDTLGTRYHFVDDIRVTTEDPSYNSYEVNGYVDIDPVIYVHGTFTGSVHDIADNHMYDYMMLGDRVSDGTYDGEYQTNVSVTGKTLDSIVVTDTQNNYNSGYVSIENGKLTGKLGGGYGGITQSTANSTCTLRFVFTDGTYEERTVAVKANPVNVHTLGAVYNWKDSTNYSSSLGTTAFGSILKSEPSCSMNSTGSSPQTYEVKTNFADIFRTASYNTFDIYRNSSTGTGSYKQQLDSMTDSSAFSTNKISGYYYSHGVGASGIRTATISSGTAKYYLDISSSTNLGFQVENNEYVLTLLLFNIYNANYRRSNNITGSFIKTSGSSTVSSDNVSLTKSNADQWTQEVKIKINPVDSEQIVGKYSLESESSNGSNGTKVIINTNISVDVVNKSLARTALNTALTNHKYSNCYTAATWAKYKTALKNLEAYICNYEADTANEQGLISALNTAAGNLDFAEKTTDTHTACVDTSKSTEAKCTEAGNIHHNYDCGYEYDEILEALGHSFSLEPKYVEAKGDDNGYMYIACTRCDAEDTTVHRSYDDQTDAWTNYSNQLAVAKEEIKNTVKYTAESIASAKQKIQEVENAVVLNDETKSRNFIDDKTSSLATAVTSLKLNQYSITLHIVGEDGNTLTNSISYPLKNYGTVQNISVPDEYKTNYSVVKWVRDSFDGSKISGLNSDTLGVVVKGNMNYYVVLRDTTGNAGENQAVVTLNNKSGKIVDVGYVEKNKEQTVTVDTEKSQITIGTTVLTAPTYSFYTLKGFYINGTLYSETGTVTITDNTVITPYYEATKQVEINRASGESFTINNENTASYRAKWNQKVVLRSEAEVYWYNEKNVILGRGTTYSFFANTQVTIHTEPVRSVENVDPTASIGYFDYDSVLNKVTVVNNFFVPSGKTAEKAGVILSTKNSTVDALKKQTNGIFEGYSNSFTSTGNQIRISVSRTATTSFKMYALAYVVVDGKTYYANEVAMYEYTAPNA